MIQLFRTILRLRLKKTEQKLMLKPNRSRLHFAQKVPIKRIATKYLENLKSLHKNLSLPDYYVSNVNHFIRTVLVIDLSLEDL